MEWQTRSPFLDDHHNMNSGLPCLTSQTFEDGNCQSQKPAKRRQSWRKAKVSPQRVDTNNSSHGEFYVIKFHHSPETPGHFAEGLLWFTMKYISKSNR